MTSPPGAMTLPTPDSERSAEQHADRASGVRRDHRAEEDPHRHDQGPRHKVLHRTNEIMSLYI